MLISLRIFGGAGGVIICACNRDITTMQIVRQYDIIVIQEVRGVNADVPNEVLNRVNQAGNDYAICNSVYRFKPASGTHREMYLYLYRYGYIIPTVSINKVARKHIT